MMKIQTLGSVFAAVTMLAVIGGVNASEDERGKYRGGASVEPVHNQQYADECGSCHFAYQPGLLPERSWRKLMANLNDHFGENAELADEERQALTDYLVSKAGDHSNARRSKKLMRSISAGDTPLRITKIPYFQREHREVPGRALEHKDVGSLSHCQACHRTADRGDFEERNIDIPGDGRWED